MNLTSDAFYMGTRVAYLLQVRQEVIEMKWQVKR